MDVFLTNYRHESSFFRELTFIHKKEARDQGFCFVKIGRKKGHPFDFVQKYSAVLQSWRFFGPNMGLTVRVLHEKFQKITWEHCFFERMDVLFTKYRHESIVYFGEWTFFWQKIGMRRVSFSSEIGKKGIISSFLVHTTG